jgi:glycosyltransferase involved in cell wall biosynthesis
MKVLVLTQFFPPEPCAASNRTIAVCAGMRAAGHDVQVVTGFPNFPGGVIPAEYRGKFKQREVVAGIPVLRVWTYASPRLRAKDRILNWVSVALSACAAAPFYGSKVDAIYVTCPPITLALPALLLSRALRCKLIVDVRDSYPDVAVKMGVWKENAPLTKIVARAAGMLYRRADAVSCVTDSVRDQVLARGASPEKTFVARNGFDPVEPADAAPYRRHNGEFVAAFAGNIGVAAGAEIILDAAARLRWRSDIRFVLAGAGSDFKRMQSRVQREHLENVELLGAVDRSTALAVLREADVCIVPLRRGIHDSLPTKIFDALYVGCPVLVSGDGEARQFVERAEGGWAVAAEDPDALASAIARCASEPKECRSAGERGKHYVAGNCDRSDAVRRIVSATERSCAIVAKSSQAYL